MTVLILENVSPGFRGMVTQWMLEVKAGVYVGNISAGVRGQLWKKVQDNVDDGAAMLIYSAQNEQGYAIEVCRTPYRDVVDMEGLYLIRRIVGEGDD
ncbi:MAG: type I-E CRISPR-associated endoribonuclease Cas2e [bacterium]